MSSRAKVTLSFLDVFCCAMGASIILAVLFSVVKHPTQPPLRRQFILVEMAMSNNVFGSGLSIITPRKALIEMIPRYGAGGEGKETSAEAPGGIRIWESWYAASNKTLVYCEIREPTEGRWILRPTMPRWTTESSTNSAVIQVTIWTRRGKVEMRTNESGTATNGTVKVRHPGHEAAYTYLVDLVK